MTRVPPARKASIEVDGQTVELHNTDKVFWPELSLTKADLISYYLAVAPYLLPHLRDRPFIMKPYPDGVGGRTFYRWEIPGYAPAWVHRWKYEPKTEERVIDMVVVEGLPELVWVASQACIEMHPWLSRTDNPAHPDLMLFDLDPGPGAGFAECLEVGAQLHALLEQLGLQSYPKTSGRDGMHVVLPIERHYTFREVRDWIRAVGWLLAEAHPDAVTLDKSLAARRGKVLVDYGQNALGKSVASAYSARATPNATVSAPLTWEEVGRGRVRPEAFTIKTVPGRLERTGDLLAPLLRERQTLPALQG